MRSTPRLHVNHCTIASSGTLVEEIEQVIMSGICYTYKADSPIQVLLQCIQGRYTNTGAIWKVAIRYEVAMKKILTEPHR